MAPKDLSWEQGSLEIGKTMNTWEDIICAPKILKTVKSQMEDKHSGDEMKNHNDVAT